MSGPTVSGELPDPCTNSGYPRHARAFGFTWQSDFPLPLFAAEPEPGRPAEIVMRRIEPAQQSPARRALPEPAQGNTVLAADGFRYLTPEATFDLYPAPGLGADRIDVLPGMAWAGALPPAHAGTVAALLLAHRGVVPMHGSAVEWRGRAVLLCGAAGAGKSTMTASLLAAGARLVADDLTILHIAHGGAGAPIVFAGRRTLRLHPATAAWLAERVPFEEAAQPAQGKLAVSPPRVQPGQPLQLGVIVILDGPREQAQRVVPANRAFPLLAAQLFRPRWMRQTPGQRLRMAALAIACRTVPVIEWPSLEVRDRSGFTACGGALTALLEDMLCGMSAGGQSVFP